MKHLLTTTALGLVLMTSPVLAQDQKPADQPMQTSPATPGAQPDAMQKPDAAQDMQKPDTAQSTDQSKSTAQASSGSIEFIDEQESGQGLASDLIGASVANADNETIGEVNDLLYDEDGKIDGVVIGVGGFLGLGAKDVAIDFGSLDVTKSENGDLKVVLNTSKESLDSAPEFATLQDKQAEQDRAARQSQTPAPSGGSPMGGGSSAPRTQ